MVDPQESTNNQFVVYMLFSTLVFSGMAIAVVTSFKIVHLGMNFPFASIPFSFLTFPLVDCICELWGRTLARQTVFFSLLLQVVVMLFIQLSIIFPSASSWIYQRQYELVLASSKLVVVASLLAFTVAQLLDVYVFQKIRQITAGRMLWLRSIFSTLLGQTIDSIIFISIVFYNAEGQLELIGGLLVIKWIAAIITAPWIYFLVYSAHWYLNYQTLAFKVE